DRAVDEARIEPAERAIAETETIHRAGTEILDQHVALARQASQDLDAVTGLEIQRHALLAAVDRHEIRRFTQDERRPLPRVVALAGLLDLDDLGAHVAQHHGRERPGQHAGEIEHANTLKRLNSGHRNLP